MCRTIHVGNWFTALFVSLAVTSATGAQNKDSECGLRFGVVRLDARLPNGGISGMTKHQSDWFKKKGTKKFPGFCEDEAKPDYLILWMSEDASGVVGGNGTVTSVQREKVRFYVVEGDKRDAQNALYSGEKWDSMTHWADQSSLEDALKFLAARQHNKK